MTDQQSNIPKKITQEIPYGYCHCGCGEKTTISLTTRKKWGHKKGCPVDFIRGHHTRINKRHPAWKGGRKKTKYGYIMVLLPEHPRSDSTGYVFEHILIAEKALGKHLPIGSQVHHANGQGIKDSGPLVLCEDDAYHKLIEQRANAFYACGNVKWRKCSYCKKYDDPQNLVVRPRTGSYHRHCATGYERKRKLFYKEK